MALCCTLLFSLVYFAEMTYFIANITFLIFSLTCILFVEVSTVLTFCSIVIAVVFILAFIYLTHVCYCSILYLIFSIFSTVGSPITQLTTISTINTQYSAGFSNLVRISQCRLEGIASHSLYSWVGYQFPRGLCTMQSTINWLSV